MVYEWVYVSRVGAELLQGRRVEAEESLPQPQTCQLYCVQCPGGKGEIERLVQVLSVAIYKHNLTSGGTGYISKTYVVVSSLNIPIPYALYGTSDSYTKQALV